MNIRTIDIIRFERQDLLPLLRKYIRTTMAPSGAPPFSNTALHPRLTISVAAAFIEVEANRWFQKQAFALPSKLG